MKKVDCNYYALAIVAFQSICAIIVIDGKDWLFAIPEILSIIPFLSIILRYSPGDKISIADIVRKKQIGTEPKL